MDLYDGNSFLGNMATEVNQENPGELRLEIEPEYKARLRCGRVERWNAEATTKHFPGQNYHSTPVKHKINSDPDLQLQLLK